MKRVVVTGIGIVSLLGNDKANVVESLRQGKCRLEYRNEQQLRLRRHQCLLSISAPASRLEASHFGTGLQAS